ncbi:hypothetical protein PU00_11650 [Hafnia alvei]|uniref:hypothetical protein n=1 Tax=Hafnia alvei TaxID=569 RepID=UPI0005839803|nr:hypothetical protein [Hafnia alvei]KID03553.1 hypothetical protein PU00_11650 [Hafnia alvei]
MQQWFYAYEVYENNEFIHKNSGIYPESILMGNADLIAVDLNSPEAAMNDISSRELIMNGNRVVFFTAFNRV